MTNVVVLRGNLTRDPEMKHIPSGTAVTNFGIAVNKGFGDKKKVSYFDVSAFGKQAQSVNSYTRKGSSVCVKGELLQDRWEKDGVKHSRVVIYADRVEFLDKRGEGSANNAPTDDGDSVPF